MFYQINTAGDVTPVDLDNTQEGCVFILTEEVLDINLTDLDQPGIATIAVDSARDMWKPYYWLIQQENILNTPSFHDHSIIRFIPTKWQDHPLRNGRQVKDLPNQWFFNAPFQAAQLAVQLGFTRIYTVDSTSRQLVRHKNYTAITLSTTQELRDAVRKELNEHPDMDTSELAYCIDEQKLIPIIPPPPMQLGPPDEEDKQWISKVKVKQVLR